MDYEKILREQLNNVTSNNNLEEITKNIPGLDESIASQFTLENIVNSTLEGQPFFNSQQLIDSLHNLFLYEIKNALILGIEILIICIVMGLLKNLSASFSNRTLSDISLLICTMAITGISINSFKISYELSANSVSTMINTMEILTPILFGVLIATGAVASGTILSPVMIGAVTGFGIIVKKIILPALFVATILALANCLTEKNYVNKLSKLIRNAAVTVTGLILTILTCIISLQGLLTEASDGLLINTAKYSLSNFIPIVGGFTSDTVELFLNCMSAIKSIIGIFGIVSLAVLILSPLIKILVIALIYKLTGALAEPVCDSKIADGLNDMGSCMISIASIMFFSALLFIIFLSIIMKLGAAQ